MVNLKQFAQVTGMPPSGASNAKDFQPPTQNPQQAPTNLQQGGGVSTGSDQKLLTDNPNVRINVPVNPADPPGQTLARTDSGGVNWLAIVLVIVVIAGVAFAWAQSWQYRFKKRPQSKELPIEKPELPVEFSAPKAPPEKTANIKAKKKSRSTRKNRRK